MDILTLAPQPQHREVIEQALSHLGTVSHLTAESPREAIGILREKRHFGVAIIDIDPWLEAPELFDLLGKWSGQLLVLAMSESSSAELVLRCLRAGAGGFVPKGSSPAQWLEAVRQVIQGRVAVPVRDGTGSTPMAEAAPSGKRSAPGTLTRRQQDVLEWLVQGKSNREIAHILGIEESTVKSHVTVLLQALGVRNRTQAALAFNEARLNGFRGGVNPERRVEPAGPLDLPPS